MDFGRGFGGMPLAVPWPLPHGAALTEARTAFAPFRGGFLAPSAATLPSSISQLWSWSHSNAVNILVVAIATLLDILIPANMNFGVTSLVISELLVNALMAVACVRLRREFQLPHAKRRAWARRLFPYFTSEAIQGISCGDSPWERWARSLLVPVCTERSAVHVLFTHATVYVGKADLH